MVVNLSVWEDGRVVNSDERKGKRNGFGGKTRISLLSDYLNQGGGGREKVCTEEDTEFEELDCKIAAQTLDRTSRW